MSPIFAVWFAGPHAQDLPGKTTARCGRRVGSLAERQHTRAGPLIEVGFDSRSVAVLIEFLKFTFPNFHSLLFVNLASILNFLLRQVGPQKE